MKSFLFGCVTIVLFSCAPTRFIKPLEHKRHAVTGSLGGALINVPGLSVMPIPNTSLGYGYGLNPELTVFGNWYTTAAVFGDIQFDAGCSYRIWKNEKMGTTISPSVNFMMDVFEKNAHIWPQLDANFYYDYFKKVKETKGGKEKIKSNYFYFGFSNWFELQETKAHDLKQNTRLVFNPQIGHTFERGKWNYTLEIKFLAPYVSNEKIVVDYISLFGNKGALGSYFGITYKL
jgi:hypothetical protein